MLKVVLCLLVVLIVQSIWCVEKSEIGLVFNPFVELPFYFVLPEMLPLPCKIRTGFLHS